MGSEENRFRRVPSDGPFFTGLIFFAGSYLLLILALLFADAQYVGSEDLWKAMRSPAILSSIRLTLITCTITALLSVLVAVPTGYLLSRFQFPGKRLIDAILDIPILLPPLVIGLSLLILFHKVSLIDWVFGRSLEQLVEGSFAWMTSIRPDIRPGITFKVPAVILAQFTVSCAFAVRTMKTTFDQIHPRHEQVAMTLGCNRSQAFWLVLLPQAWRGVLTGGTLSWARALGEFGPILVFAGATRGRTEVLSTTVFLEINIGNLKGAVAVSLLMILMALAVILIVRTLGERSGLGVEERRRKSNA